MSDDARTDPSISRDEHDTVSSAKRVTPLLWNGSGTSKAPTPFLTKPFDQLVVTYTDTTKTVVSSVVSKLAGVTQETITNTASSTIDNFLRT
jgi:hypothetical protein